MIVVRSHEDLWTPKASVESGAPSGAQPRRQDFVLRLGKTGTRVFHLSRRVGLNYLIVWWNRPVKCVERWAVSQVFYPIGNHSCVDVKECIYCCGSLQ